MNEEKLTIEIKRLQKQVQELQEKVGNWRRMAQEKAPYNEFFKERHDNNVHYIYITVRDIPKDYPLHDAQRHMFSTIIPAYPEYRYYGCYKTTKQGWVCILSKYDDDVELFYEAALYR